MSTMIPDLQGSQPPRVRLQAASLRSLAAAIFLFALSPLVSAAQNLQPPPPPALPAQPQQASPAVVARVTAAKTIFLSNAGANDSFSGTIPGGPNVSYNELYAALQQWGYFQLVDSPAHADLVFQIRGTQLAPSLAPTFTGHTIAQQHAALLVLTILDPHQDPATPTPLDSLTTLAGRAETIPRGNIAFAQSIEWLTYQISTRVSAPRSNPGKLLDRNALRPSFESLINSTAPIPPQVLHAKTIYLQDDPATTPATAKPDHYFQGFQTALNQWEYYTLTPSPTTADLILRYHNTIPDGTWITLEDPSTHIILWTITDPHYGFYRQTGPRRVTALNQNLITLLKQLNHLPLTQAETAALH